MTLDREPKETAREEKAVHLPLYLYVCVCAYVYVCEERKRGKRTKRAKQLVVLQMIERKQRLKKDELDATRRKKARKKWKGGWEGMVHLGGGASD